MKLNQLIASQLPVECNWLANNYRGEHEKAKDEKTGDPI